MSPELKTQIFQISSIPSYLSCSPAIITSALCCLAMVFLLMLLVRSMFVICGPESKWRFLSYGSFYLHNTL